MNQKRIDIERALQPRRRIRCGDNPSESGCTVTISGTEDEVVQLTALHAVDAHGEKDSPALRELIRGMLLDDLP